METSLLIGRAGTGARPGKGNGDPDQGRDVGERHPATSTSTPWEMRGKDGYRWTRQLQVRAAIYTGYCTGDQSTRRQQLVCASLLT